MSKLLAAKAASSRWRSILTLADPTQGLFSNTDATKGAVLRQMITDRIQAILLGRAPMSDYDQRVADWRSQGGDQIRAEYQQALAARP